MPALVSRQHRRLQALARHAALRDAARRADGRGRLPARRRQPRDGLGRRGRRRDRREPGRRGHLVHRQLRRPASASPPRPGARLKRLALELGGKNGVVVLADADLDLAADGILWSAFGTTGQRCTACSPGDRRAVGRRAAARAARGAGPQAPARFRPGRDRPTSGRSSTRPRSTRSTATSTSAAAKGELVIGGGRATRRRPRPRPLLRADDLRGRRGRWTASARRRSSGPVLSVIPVDDYGEAMLAAQPDPLRPLVEHLHAAT